MHDRRKHGEGASVSHYCGAEQSEPVDEEDVGGDERQIADGSLTLGDNKARLSI